MKKASIITLITGIILLAAGFALPMIAANGQVPFALCCFGGVTALWGGIGWLFQKKIGSHCRIETSGIALGISAVVSLGVHCVMSFLSCYFLTNPARHPIRHPASILLGTVCFALFAALVYWYTKLRKKNASAVGVALDIGLGVLYLPAFYFIWVVIDNTISKLI